jgi:predicted nucleotidyltransferase
MRIDPKGEIAGYPALLVRKALRNLRTADGWGLWALEAAAKLSPGAGRSMAKALRKSGLIELTDPGRWTVTQAGRTTAAATAAREIRRATAEKALAQFLERVTRVNTDPYFLARVTRLVLFGSMLRPKVERLSDVDLAVQLEAKEKDVDRLRAQTLRRVEELAAEGHWFRDFLEGGLVVFRNTSISEGRKPCDLFGRLQRREGSGIGRSAPCADWGAGRTPSGGRTGNSETGTTEAPPARLSVLSGRKAKVR